MILGPGRSAWVMVNDIQGGTRTGLRYCFTACFSDLPTHRYPPGDLMITITTFIRADTGESIFLPCLSVTRHTCARAFALLIAHYSESEPSARADTSASLSMDSAFKYLRIDLLPVCHPPLSKISSNDTWYPCGRTLPDTRSVVRPLRKPCQVG